MAFGAQGIKVITGGAAPGEKSCNAWHSGQGRLSAGTRLPSVLFRGGAIRLMAFKRHGRQGLMPGFGVRISGCPGLKLLPGMPIGHCRVEQEQEPRR